jgi:hypothetical protein
MLTETPELVADESILKNNIELLAEPTKEEKTSVLGYVFKSIFVEVPKNFFSGIGDFFKRYYRHYVETFTFFNRPSLKVAPFSKKDFKENTQHSFEIALIFTAVLFFLIKQDVIPADKELQAHYGNDIMQMFMEFMVFVIFALAYSVLIVLSVLSGRLVRSVFKVPVTRTESDILFAFLNNSFFSVAALLAFLFRCTMQYEQIEGTETESGVTGFCILLSFVLTVWWSVRFARLNHLSVVKKLIFYVVSITWFTILFGLGMAAICMFILGA